MIAASYVKLLRSPGVPRLAAAFLALGVANTMTPVAFVLFAHAATHSFATASLVLAASTAGGLVFGPARGRLVDRIGPRGAVLALAVPDVLTDAAFIAGGQVGVPRAVLVAMGFVAGAVAAPAMAALRTVWSETLAEADARQAGYALMAMLVETSYITGPLLAAALIALWSATAAVAATAVLSLIGAVAFATGLQTDKPLTGRPSDARPRRLSAIAGSGIRTLLATAGGFGVTFGVLDVAFPAFARTHGSAAAAGLLLSAFAVGAWIGGFAYGLRPRGRTAGALYPGLCLLAAIGLAPLLLLPSLKAMIALAVISGLCFAPVSNCQLAVIDEVADARHKAEVFAWLGTVYGTGLAVGAAAAGQLLATSGIRAAVGTACGAALLAAGIAAVRSGTLRATPDPGRGLASAPATEAD